MHSLVALTCSRVCVHLQTVLIDLMVTCVAAEVIAEISKAVLNGFY